MNPQNAESIRVEIIQIIKSMNQAWLTSDFNGLRDILHESIVIVTPDMKRVGTGIDPCIESYKEFVSDPIFSVLKKKVSMSIPLETPP